MKVLRADVVAMAEAIGYKTAGQWSKSKMAKQLEKIADETSPAETTLEDEKLAGLLAKIVEANGKVEVVQSEEDLVEVTTAASAKTTEAAEATPVKATPALEQPKAEVKVCKKCGSTEFDEDGDCAKCLEPSLQSLKKKRKKSGAAGKPGVQWKPEDGGPAFLTGKLMKKYGFNAEITDAMVAELDALCGKSNLKQARNNLRCAKRFLSGYFAE